MCKALTDIEKKNQSHIIFFLLVYTKKNSFYLKNHNCSIKFLAKHDSLIYVDSFPVYTWGRQKMKKKKIPLGFGFIMLVLEVIGIPFNFWNIRSSKESRTKGTLAWWMMQELQGSYVDTDGPQETFLCLAKLWRLVVPLLLFLFCLYGQNQPCLYVLDSLWKSGTCYSVSLFQEIYIKLSEELPFHL